MVQIGARFGPYPATPWIYGFVWPSPEPVTLTVAVQPLAAKDGKQPEKKTVTLMADGTVDNDDRADGATGGPTQPHYTRQNEVDRFAVTEDELKQADIARKIAVTERLLLEKGYENARRFGLSSYEGTFKVVKEGSPAAKLGVEEGDLAAVVADYEARVRRYFTFESIEVKEEPARRAGDRERVPSISVSVEFSPSPRGLKLAPTASCVPSWLDSTLATTSVFCV